MIFLDLEVPQYESMRTQEHKVPNLIKTLRGKGTVENSNEYNFDDRLHLNFTVNETNLKKFIKLYSRFQTMCLIPMFDSGLKHKIYDSYEEYRKNTLNAYLQSIIDNDVDFSDVIENKFKEKNPNETYLDVMKNKENGYTINPNVRDCMMVFLESFSFHSIHDSSDGYEVEMILWVCNDLTFYTDNEKNFLEEYYKEFIKKQTSFEEIDKKIDSLFESENLIENLRISFRNIYNEQETYSSSKQVEKLGQPQSIAVANKYISQLEVRMSNNLRRIPLVGKSKGFMQHLGKGEIGVTFKLIFNQKNAVDERVISDLKSLPLYQQEFLTTMNIDFFLLKALDIKELSLVTSVIEEPSDDVDVTVVTLLFTGSGATKIDMANDSFNILKRENSSILIKLFNKYLDVVLDKKVKYSLKPNKNKVFNDENTEENKKFILDSLLEEQKFESTPEEYQKKLEEFGKMIISKNDRRHYQEGQEEKLEEYEYATGNLNSSNELNKDFKLSNLFDSYYQKRFQEYADGFDKGNSSIISDLEELKIEDTPNIGAQNFYGIFDGVLVNDIVKDSFYTDYVMTRIEKLVFKMLCTYHVTRDEETRDIFISQIATIDNETQIEFVQKIFVRFLAEFFEASSMADTKKMVILAVVNTFKIEVINNIVMLSKLIIDNDKRHLLATENDRTSFDPVFIHLIDDNGEFQPVIRDFIVDSVITCFKFMDSKILENSFVRKSLDYIKSNFLDGIDDDANLDSSFEKAIKVEIEKLSLRLQNIMKELENSDCYLIQTIEMLFKLNVLSARKNKFKITFGNDEMFHLNKRAQTLLISNCIMSLLIADISYERSIYGVIAIESAKNMIAPHAVTYTALDTTIGEITALLSKKLQGKTLDDYLNKLVTDKTATGEEVKTYKEFYDNLNNAKKVYEFLFKKDKEKLLSLNGTFTKVANTNLDFQKYLNIAVFNTFESPMDFIKKISKSLEVFKKLHSTTSQDLEYLENLKEGITLDSILQELKDSNKDIRDAIEKSLKAFSAADTIANLTINNNEVGNVLPTTIMNTELLGELKLLRGMRNATRLVTSQYERMIPNYEVLIIDEKAMEMAFSRRYDYADKIYSVNNIISINIKKDDVTNIKYAIVKIANTSPHYTGFDTLLESQSVFSDNSEPSIVYNSKYVTNRMAFRVGMLIAISLDVSNQFFDFTGRIDSVNINADTIVVKCSNFSAELMGKLFDIHNITKTGLTGFPRKLINFFTKMNRTGEAIATSKSDVEKLNGHLIPNAFADGRTKGNDFKANLGGACGILFTALDSAIDSIKHLDCSYNDLLSGHRLNQNLMDGSNIGVDALSKYTYGHSADTTSHRITENINAVEFDVSFYGASYLKIMENREDLEGANYTVDTGKGVVLLGHSSFVPNRINNLNNNEAFDTNFNIKANLKNGKYIYEPKDTNKIYDGKIMGYEFSYSRNSVSLYNVLNDLTYRNPATYWDVFESGYYGTLFFGRNNYMMTRKNKTANLSREDVDLISELLIANFKPQNFNEDLMTSEELIGHIKYLSETASIYDGNFSKDKKILDKVNKGKLKIQRTKNKVFKDLSSIDKDLYSEESPVTDVVLALSGYNLISCNISTNEGYYNSVEVRYKPGLGDRMDRLSDLISGKSNKILLKTFEGLKDDRLRTNFIDTSLTTDLHTSKQAFEFAQSVMFKELTNYYSGKVVILYCPTIKKFDEVVIIDSRNKITGTVVVKDFEHVFDVESGAITIITPGMKVKTSSMLTDIYLTGLVNKLSLEWHKMYERKVDLKDITKINESVSGTLNRMFDNMFRHVNEVPIAFDLTGYNAVYDEEANKKSLNQQVGDMTKGNDDFTVTQEIKMKEDAETIVTPRNISNLPFKIYPLIKSGKPLMPDEDIYNSTDGAFNFLERIYITLKAMSQTYLDLSDSAAKILGCLNEVFSNIDVSEEGYLDGIVNQFFSKFISNSNTTEKEAKEFLDRMLADDYSHLELFDKDRIVLDRNLFYDKQSIVFFNCQKLNQYEDDRIDKIAKILCQFSVVNLVELDGRVTKDGKKDGEIKEFENNNFTVVTKLVNAMNKYNKTIIKKKNPNMTEWTCVIQDRLIRFPMKYNRGDDDSTDIGYDDVGAVLINCPKHMVNDIITVKNKFYIESEVTVGQPKSDERYALHYEIKVKNGLMKVANIPVFVLHNHYGQSRAVIDFRLRTAVLDNLLGHIYREMPYQYLVAGDYNLIVRDRYEETDVPDRINELYFVTKQLDRNPIFNWGSDGIVAIKKGETTTGNKRYDNFIISELSFSLFDKATQFYYENSYSNKETNLVSDHYPIYMTLKNINNFIPEAKVEK